MSGAPASTDKPPGFRPNAAATAITDTKGYFAYQGAPKLNFKKKTAIKANFVSKPLKYTTSQSKDRTSSTASGIKSWSGAGSREITFVLPVLLAANTWWTCVSHILKLYCKLKLYLLICCSHHILVCIATWGFPETMWLVRPYWHSWWHTSAVCKLRDYLKRLTGRRLVLSPCNCTCKQ